jgi:putative FmdB family regulatory protein
MPLYEYHCDRCDQVFEALGTVSRSGEPAKCPACGEAAERIMPTTFASMSRRRGLKERVPFHHRDVRADTQKKAIAPVRKAKSSSPAKKKSSPRKAI